MNKWIISVGVFTAICVGARTEEEIHVFATKGALASVAIKVEDDHGFVVTNATVTGNFHMNDNKGTPFNGTTDTNGIYIASGKCVGDWHFFVKKDGYYETFKDLSFFKPNYTSIADGCWQPYGMTNTVVLKRKVNPVALKISSYLKGQHLIPEVGVPLGFDLDMNDWVFPHGKGKAVDFTVTYLWDGSKFGQYTGSDLIISFTNKYTGVYKAPCDSFSAFKSPYRADTNASFLRELKFSLKRKGGIKDGQLQAGECLIMSVRPRLDKDGNLIGTHYAKIYGPWRFGFGDKTPGSMSMACYFNPNENDTNLEADTTRNLLNPDDLGFAP